MSVNKFIKRDAQRYHNSYNSHNVYYSAFWWKFTIVKETYISEGNKARKHRRTFRFSSQDAPWQNKSRHRSSIYWRII